MELLGWTFVLVCAGLLLRFTIGCVSRMRSAVTFYEFFTAILALLVGLVFFPLTIFFQALAVIFRD